MNTNVKQYGLSKKHRIVFFIYSAFMLLLAFVILIVVYNLNVQKVHDTAKANAENVATGILSELRRCYETTEIMNDLHKAVGDKFLVSFRKVCSELQNDNFAIGSMYWAPDGVIQYAYPDKVDEATRNFNMFDDPVQGPKAQLARDSHLATIAGPHNLIEGGQGFIIRNPNYDDDGNFVAFSIMVINTNAFFQQVMNNLKDINGKYRFSVWKEEDPTAILADGKYIYSSEKPIEEEVIAIDFQAPNDTWHLAIEPIDGWYPIADMRYALIVVTISFILLIVCFYVILHNYQMKSEFEEVTSEKKRMYEIQKYQTDLEILTQEQAKQLSKISELNNELQAEKDKISEAYIMIEGLSHDFHTIYIVNRETMQMRLVRSEKDKTIATILRDSVYEQGFANLFNFYVDKYVIDTDRIRVRKEITKEVIFHQLDTNGYYAVNYMRRDDSGQFAYNQVTFTNAGKEPNSKHFVVAFRDIDEMLKKEETLKNDLESARKAAEDANQAKTSFLFNMSHDIRTPMNAIIGFRNLLEKYQDDPVRRADYLKKIEESSSVLLSIINNVLEMARIEKGTIILDEIAWSAEQLSDTLYSVFIDLMEQKKIKFTYEVKVTNQFIYCDPTKMREVFLNIISNAYKYTKEGGSVHMLLEEIPSDREGYATYRTTISDTGIGMDKSYLPHLFEEFSREHNTTDNKIEGTGLGMSIVKRLVELMGGTIEVESELGVGTTFVVTLSHRIAQRTDLASSVKADEADINFEGKRILLAEDNDLNAEIATEILSELQLKVERAEDGQVAVDMLEKAPSGYYDLILMDVQMPNMDGYTATRTIRRFTDSAKASIPIIALTANAFEEDRREVFNSGMDNHLAKPINIPDLIKTIASIFYKA